MIKDAPAMAGSLEQIECLTEMSVQERKHALEVRILLLTPNGRDTQRVIEALAPTGMIAVVCATADVLMESLPEGAAAAIIAQEALSPESLPTIAAWLALQPAWSDLPLGVLLCAGNPNPDKVGNSRDIESLGNVMLLDRPLRSDTIRSWLRVAVRARTRQYAARRDHENLAIAVRDLEQFAHSASHDLREPLRMVALYSELLSTRYRDKLDDQGQTFLSYISSASARMDMLVRDLLTYTQAASFDAGAADEPVEVANGSIQLSAALANLRDVIDTSEAIVTCDVLPDVTVKPVHLQQLFQNLLSNAIKYRRASMGAPCDERVRIHVGASREKNQWRFSVSDNGIGIEPRFQEQIFGIFKRLHTNEKFAGSGIGLAICRKIVERYGGHIGVESALGEGSTFYFTAPAA